MDAPAGRDRISNLTESLIHHILSFLEIKQVAQTSVLSKQWRSIWTSVPILVFDERRGYDPDSAAFKIDKFMAFVDGTLLRRNRLADIQKFSLTQGNHMDEYRVASWITNVVSRNVQEFVLSLWQEESEDPFVIPVSLCTCESLVSLRLEINQDICLPKCIYLPKLKRLTLRFVPFDDDCWNEKLFSKCPVLEDLILEDCYYGTSFCISSATLKLLKIYNWDHNGLDDCGLKIHAPNLVSLVYWAWVAKEFLLPASPKLVEADVLFSNEYGTSVTQFFRALTHVKRLNFSDATLQALSSSDDLLENLPTFHNTKQLIMSGESSDKALIALLKATPNLESLVLDKSSPEEEDDVAVNENDDWILDAVIPGCLFAHLKSVSFKEFIGNPTEKKWVQLILKNAGALQTMTISCFRYAGLLNGKGEELMVEITSLPRASTSCVFKFPSWRS